MEEFLSGLQRVWEGEVRKKIITFRSPVEIWGENPTFLACEIFTYIWTFLTLRHASRRGGRCLQLWVTALMYGLVVEHLSYVLPEIDNFWHSRTTVMFSENRLPIYVVLFYPCLYYTTNMAVSRLKLSMWSEPFAVGLADLILDIPFDIMGIKLLWWSWHDTDPNLFDRTYNVPLTSYLFHMSFASSFTLILNMSRKLLTGSADKEKPTSNYFAEFVCMILTAALSMPAAVLFQFLPLYHPFHDFYGIHTELCVWVFIGLYCILAWSGDRASARTQTAATGSRSKHSYFNELSLIVLLHCCFYVVLVFFSTPETYLSTGPHQTIGDCNHTTYINTIAGLKLPKQTYLCAENYNEPYFDFNCLNSVPSNGSSYYTMCGNPFPNHMEYKLVIVGVALFTLAFYYQLLFRSAPPTPVARQQKVKKN